ncbi:hypothetical protein BP5796_06025 [Coleophoma crateriformis]|uniref:Homeobox domain-containing protein n=1 Tax=Coleophoma crateriformis TaxID=565419 RepID=A0A3D8RVU2_9HELO|nr:hypothetical protein BP5796_06025 [Coleophoma crateriformis]
MSNASSPPALPAATGDVPPVSSPSGGETDNSQGLSTAPDATTSSGGERKTDNKQKRKRTSPEDQLVLEGFYKQNPKPNKAARAEILKDVKGMNEKEIQIWFQNRRQIHRRKQQPLLPHELAAFGLGNVPPMSSDPITGLGSSQGTEPRSTSPPRDRSSSQGSCVSIDEIRIPQSQDGASPAIGGTGLRPVPMKPESDKQSQLPQAAESKDQSPSDHDTITTAQSVTQSFTSTPGYLANRWNAVNNAFSTPTSSAFLPFATPSVSFPGQPLSCPERIGSLSFSTPPSSQTPPSQIRLSMSLDGKAEIVPLDASPPRTHTPRPSSSGSLMLRRRSGLRRSYSALPFGSLPPKSSPSTFSTPRLPTGRSRDTRTWEFCCDGDARDELTTQAVNESSGSAVAAISLLRSTSSSALKNNSNKRNTPTSKPASNAQGKKPKLGRAMSSLARLQSTTIEPHAKGKGKDGNLVHSPGDSDKENWSPTEFGEAPHPRRRRPLPSGRQKQGYAKRTLGDNHNIPSQAIKFGVPLNKNKRRKSAHKDSEIFEDQENRSQEVGEEVQKFMSGEISPSKKGDLDCVQGLLSLSQGNWR